MSNIIQFPREDEFRFEEAPMAEDVYLLEDPSIDERTTPPRPNPVFSPFWVLMNLLIWGSVVAILIA